MELSVFLRRDGPGILAPSVPGDKQSARFQVDFTAFVGKGILRLPSGKSNTISSMVWECETSDGVAGRKITHAYRHACIHTAFIRLQCTLQPLVLRFDSQEG